MHIVLPQTPKLYSPLKQPLLPRQVMILTATKDFCLGRYGGFEFRGEKIKDEQNTKGHGQYSQQSQRCFSIMWGWVGLQLQCPIDSGPHYVALPL